MISCERHPTADLDRVPVVVLAEPRHARLDVALETRSALADQLPLGEAWMEGLVPLGDRVPAVHLHQAIVGQMGEEVVERFGGVERILRQGERAGRGRGHG